MNSGNKIFIIGMPGSGKSTIGKLLATSLNFTYYDLDIEIERESNKTIAEIFSSEGEDNFRSLENDTFQKLVASEGPFVMSTGGGTPCFYNNIEKMNSSGSTIYLEVPIEILLSRIEKNRERPLLQKDLGESLESLYSTRRKCYEKATYLIDRTEVSADNIADHIVQLLRKAGY